MVSVCDIVIPVWNQRERTRACLESLSAQTPEPVRLVLIDNGSDAETRDTLDHFQRESRIPTLIIRNKSNLGFIRATNQGIRASRAPWVCLLNNDTLLTQGWLGEMIRAAGSDARIGLVNPTSNSLGFRPGSLSPEEYAASLKAQSGRWTELTTALGFCLLARRSLFDQVGLLDESFGMGNFDDDDLSRRVRKAGLLCVRACAAYVHHDEKASFRELPGWEKAFEDNRRRFEARWGRSLRILWAFPGAPPAQAAELAQAAGQLAREGHWLWWVGPPGSLPPELSSRAQIRRLEIPPIGWGLPALARLLTKRKKPFHLVIGYDETWLRWVRRFHWLHGITPLCRPNAQEILTRCQALSRSP